MKTGRVLLTAGDGNMESKLHWFEVDRPLRHFKKCLIVPFPGNKLGKEWPIVIKEITQWQNLFSQSQVVLTNQFKTMYL